jgi:hypothetical protein
MTEFLKSYGTLILAIYGIVQIWLIALWRRFFRQGEISIYETGAIEVGYSGFGPTVGLYGTLRAINKDVFARTIDLLIIRNKDKSQHVFRWLAFRSPQIYLAGSQPPPLEIPSGFLVTSNFPHRYNILFNDPELLEEMRPQLNKYFSEWYRVADNLHKLKSRRAGAIPTPEQMSNQDDLIENFRNSPVHVETYSTLNRNCYWEPGECTLVFTLRASKPDRIFSKTYKFQLNDQDSKNLKLNAITILEEPVANYLQIQNYPYHFAYSPYIQGTTS